jgi:hypothetical protein
VSITPRTTGKAGLREEAGLGEEEQDTWAHPVEGTVGLVAAVGAIRIPSTVGEVVGISLVMGSTNHNSSRARHLDKVTSMGTRTNAVATLMASKSLDPNDSDWGYGIQCDESCNIPNLSCCRT